MTLGSRFFLLCGFSLHFVVHYPQQIQLYGLSTQLLSKYYTGKHSEPNARWHNDLWLLTASKRKGAAMSAVELGQKFSSIAVAKQTVNEYIVYQGWSYRTYKSGPNRCWAVICRQAKEHKCAFRIRLTVRRTEIELTVLEPHTCPHSVHHNFRLPNTIKMITSNARNLSLITDDPTARSKHIATNEHIDRGIRIPYLQGHRAAEYKDKCLR